MNDPYFDTEFCVDRLYKEYSAHKKLIVALDFDDTIFDFHNKGYQYSQVIDLILECQRDYGFYVVIFTGTPPEKWTNIYNHCEKLGIKTGEINKNAIPLPFGNGGKIYYNILLDDRSGLQQSFEILRKTVDRIKKTKQIANT